MLFNSYSFLFVFLPITLLVFFSLGRRSRPVAALWLFFASLFFYGWWNPTFVALLLASICFNFGIGRALVRQREQARDQRVRRLLLVGVAINLSLLAYYKYANFFVTNISAAFDVQWRLATIVLPLGISFFTFTQIAFLVDAARGEVKETNFIHYGLFVTYFPHLIAGPVLHHKEMMPQFDQPETYRPRWENFSVGLTMFTFGLLKKVALADRIAPYATPVFDAAVAGTPMTPLDAWGGALAYAFQLYFDFSGYSDMAIGISRMFGVTLPLNFDSPYKSINIIDFWRRWHITLSRFLRDYLYVPLGGNRKGLARRYVNLLTTMVLGGLWHGAGWTFVIWGTLHGIYLVINHGWHALRKAAGFPLPKTPSFVGRAVGMTMTFAAVVVAWVFFRAANVEAALHVVRPMFGLGGATTPARLFALIEIEHRDLAAWLAVLWAIAWLAPNSQQMLAAYGPAFEPVSYQGRLTWRPSFGWLVGISFGLLYAVIKLGGKASEFLYFQF